MKMCNKIIGLVLIFIILLQVNSFAEINTNLIDTSKKGSIALVILQDRNKKVIASDGTGEVQTIPDGAEPLADVEFALYRVDDEYESLEIPEEAPLKRGSTDENGMLSFLDLELGRYLLTVTKYPSNVSIEIANFLVDVPMVNVTRDAWNYNVKIYPKLQTVYGTIVLNNLDELEKPMPNVKFQLRKENEFGDYEKYTNIEYIIQEDYVTNKNGQICIENLPDGKYQLVEMQTIDGYGLNKTPIPFEITETSLQTEDSEGRFIAAKDELNLEMRNYRIPAASDFVFGTNTSDGKPTSSSNMDGTHDWIIEVEVPKDIENYTRFLVTDKISDQLILDVNSVEVRVDGQLKIKDVDYKVYYENNELKISFVDKGVPAELLKGKSKIEISYNTEFNRDTVVMGQDITNEPKLFFDTIYDLDGADENDIPSNPTGDDLAKVLLVKTNTIVRTGGLKIKKINNQEMPLAGAKFKIATSMENANKGEFIKVDNEDMEAVSGEDGLLYFKGLSYGQPGDSNDVAKTEYFLVEVQSPEGYNLLTKPVSIIVDKNSYDTNSPTTIKNKRGLVIPETGGIGTVIFTVIGIGIMGAAVVIFVKKEN